MRAKGTVRAPKGSNGLGGVFDWLGLGMLMGVLSIPARSVPVGGRPT